MLQQRIFLLWQRCIQCFQRTDLQIFQHVSFTGLTGKLSWNFSNDEGPNLLFHFSLLRSKAPTSYLCCPDEPLHRTIWYYQASHSYLTLQANPSAHFWSLKVSSRSTRCAPSWRVYVSMIPQHPLICLQLYLLGGLL